MKSDKRGKFMKRKGRQVSALLCATFLAVAFTACAKADAPDDTTQTTLAIETLTAEESETSTQTQTTEKKPDDETKITQTQDDTRPTDVAKGVALFNEAVAKVQGIEATYSRKLDEATALKFNLMDFGVAPEFDLDNQPLPNPKITSIDASAVHGNGGFMYFIDFAETKELVSKIADKLSQGALKIEMYEEGVQIQLTVGELVATIDKTTGKMSKGTLSFTETVKGKVKAGLSGQAVIVGHGTGTFLFS